MGEFVRLEVDGGIGTIRLDRPPVNALNEQVQDELRTVAEEAGARRDVRAVIIYGGEKAFVAGADIKQMAERAYVDAVDKAGALTDALTVVARIPKPVVAAITGFALGGGLELALCADFRVCGDNARLGQPEIALGIIPGAGGTQRLPRLIGVSKAKELIYTGRHVRAEEALAIGLVDKVVPADEVYAAAREMAGQFVAGPAYALRAAKEAIDRGLEVDLDTGLEIERLHFVGLFATQDRATGMQSFIENGPGKAVFEGK
ncbi:MAG: enoyl-CoA hydratase/isomerase family protein [Motilibacteraceae bacterium]